MLVHRKALHFCILTLYAATFLNPYISSNTFLMCGYEFGRKFYRRDYVTCKQRWFYFLSSLGSFSFLSCPAALGRSSSTTVNRSGEGDILLCSRSQGRTFRSFATECNVSCGLSQDARCPFEEVPFYFRFGKCSHREKVLDFCQIFFSAAVQMIMWFSSFIP